MTLVLILGAAVVVHIVGGAVFYGYTVERLGLSIEEHPLPFFAAVAWLPTLILYWIFLMFRYSGPRLWRRKPDIPKATARKAS